MVFYPFTLHSTVVISQEELMHATFCGRTWKDCCNKDYWNDNTSSNGFGHGLTEQQLPNLNSCVVLNNTRPIHFPLVSPPTPLDMSLLLAASIASITMTSLFIIEVAAIVVKKDFYKPSRYIQLVATWMYNAFWTIANAIGILSDVFGALRRMILLIRDTFFRFIPREAIIEAWDNLKKAFGAVFKSPLGFVWGLWEAVLGATLPWLSATVLFVGFVVCPIVLEMVLRMFHITWLPSTFLLWLGTHLYNGAWKIGSLPYYIWDLTSVLRYVLEPVFAMFQVLFPMEHLHASVASMKQGLGSVFSSPIGFIHGLYLGETTESRMGAVVTIFLGAVVCLTLLYASNTIRDRHERKQAEAARIRHGGY